MLYKSGFEFFSAMVKIFQRYTFGVLSLSSWMYNLRYLFFFNNIPFCVLVLAFVLKLIIINAVDSFPKIIQIMRGVSVKAGICIYTHRWNIL